MLISSVVIFSTSCKQSSEPKISCNSVGVFDYSDFGPQAMAFDFIGNEWWQWLAQGNGQPNIEYPIKVVVHADTKLSFAQDKYPISEVKKDDYRYVSYSMTLNYLNSNLSELALFQKDGQSFESLIETLQNTQTRVEKEICSK